MVDNEWEPLGPGATAGRGLVVSTIQSHRQQRQVGGYMNSECVVVLVCPHIPTSMFNIQEVPIPSYSYYYLFCAHTYVPVPRVGRLRC